jgi:hypothetical protein
MILSIGQLLTSSQMSSSLNLHKYAKWTLSPRITLGQMKIVKGDFIERVINPEITD